jgi:hypothetical protein
VTSRIVIEEYRDGNLVQRFDFEPYEQVSLTWDTVAEDDYYAGTIVVARPIAHVIRLEARTLSGTIQRCPHKSDAECTCFWKAAAK